MSIYYQNRDFEIADYQLFQLNDNPYFFRGPRPPSLQRGRYIAYVGAAQTFGVFCRFPYPNLLAERLIMPSLNLGVGGAGPGLFLTKPFLKKINAARICVVQVLSARSVDNSKLLALNHSSELVRRDISGDSPRLDRIQYERLYRELSELEFVQLIEETRDNWVTLILQLLSAIAVPKVLFWFSHRSPDQIDDYSELSKVFNSFPQFVNRDMLDKVIPYADAFVEVTSNRGLPQRLQNRFTGLPASFSPYGSGNEKKKVNDYYPSPHMHIDAAEKLEPILSSILEDHPFNSHGQA